MVRRTCLRREIIDTPVELLVTYFPQNIQGEPGIFMVLATNADRVIDQVLENLDGLAQVVAKVASQYLVKHRTHRGAVWASGAAHAAQVVRIMVGLAR